MTHMDASALPPDESKELAELRRRAYGTAAGIANDPAAQARLEELENANRAQPVVPDVPHSDSTQAAAADDSPSIPPTSLLPVPTANASASSSRRRWLGIAAIAVTAALAGGAATAFGLSAASGMGAGLASPSATASLSTIPLAASSADVTVEPNPALTADSLQGAATWAEAAGFDLETLQGYQAVGAITPWTATRWDGQQDCVLLTMNAGEVFSHVACVLKGRAATLGVAVTTTSVDGSPHEAILLFTSTGSGMEARAVDQ